MYTTRNRGLGLNISSLPSSPQSLNSLVGQGAGMVSDMFLPGSSSFVGPIVSGLTSVLHIRAGANEADKIVPVQNEIHQGLAQVDQILQSSVSVPQLQDTFATVQQWGRDFLGFLTGPDFHDGRASAQAANTIMPMLDGTGNYTWPDMRGQIVNTDKWGNPTNGGRLGSLARRIMSLGGTAAPPQITQGGNGGGSVIPTLQFQTPGSASLPQAGWLPPTSPLSQIQTAGFSIPEVGGSDYTLPLLMAAGFLFFAAPGRGRRRHA